MHDSYLWLKALHIIALIAWMAGMLYLPRLFVYHAGAESAEQKEMLKTMERRLLRAIMNPAMIATFVFGFAVAIKINAFDPVNGTWLHAKLALVLALAGIHGFLARERGRLARDETPRTAKFYKIINESVTVLMVGIVLLVVLKPF